MAPHLLRPPARPPARPRQVLSALVATTWLVSATARAQTIEMGPCDANGKRSLPAERKLTISYGIRADTCVGAPDVSACKASEVNKITRIDICDVLPTGALSCPADVDPASKFLVWDQLLTGGAPPISAENVRLPTERVAAAEAIVPFPYDVDPGRVLVVRANKANPVLANTGFCVAPVRVGFEPTAGPVGASVLGIAEAGYPVALPAGLSHCLGNVFRQPGRQDDACCSSDRVAFELAGFASAMKTAARLTMVGYFGQNDAWQVSCSGPPADCPMRLLLGTTPGYNSGFEGGIIRAASRQHFTANFASYVNPSSADDLDKWNHEFMHTSQHAAGVAAGTSAENESLFFQPPFGENQAVAVGNYACLADFPFVPQGTCVSAGKAVGTDDGRISFSQAGWVATPSLDILSLTYNEWLWRYWAEQFAEPVVQAGDVAFPPHPSGVTSLRAAPTGTPAPPLDARFSDEGLDIHGRVMDTVRAAYPFSATSFVGAIGQGLQASLGRSLPDTLVDFHTAMLLKEYRVVTSAPRDRRWKWTWIGRKVGASTEITTPVPVGPDPRQAAQNEILPGTTAETNYPWWPRVGRMLDSFLSCTAGAAGCAPCVAAACPSSRRRSLSAGRTIASSTPAVLEQHGAAYFSVHPAANVEHVRFRARSPWPNANGLPVNVLPTFRAFTVDNAGSAQLVAACASVAPGTQRQACTESTPGVVDLGVQFAPGTVDEILVVASAPDAPARFDWAFGEGQPSVRIVSPTAGSPELVGSWDTSTSPPFDGRRAFVSTVSVTNGDGLPVTGLATKPGVFDVEAPGCSLPSCKVPPGAVGAIELGGGLYQVIATLPETFYPAPTPGGTYSLRVLATFEFSGLVPHIPSDGTADPVQGSYLVASEVEPNALVVEPHAVVRVVQVAQEMTNAVPPFSAPSSAMQAIGEVFGASLGADLSNPAKVAAIRFYENAVTKLPISAVSPATINDFLAALRAYDTFTSPPAMGLVALGDAVLTAQSNLIAAGYDQVPTGAGSPLPLLETVVVSATAENAGCGWGSALNGGYGGPSDAACKPAPPNGHTLCPPQGPCDELAPWTRGVSGELSNELRGGDLLRPRVSTIAIGEQASHVALQTLAFRTGGRFVVVSNPGAGGFPKIFSAATTVVNHALRLDRQAVGLYASLAAVPPLTVGESYERLRVTLATPTGVLPTMRLVGSRGGSHEATLSAGRNVATMDLARPPRGSWTLEVDPPAPGDVAAGPIAVDVASQGGARLLAHVDTTDFAARGHERRRRVGDVARVVATLVHPAEAVSATIAFTAVSPSGAVESGYLTEQPGSSPHSIPGRPIDDRAGDGVLSGALQAREAGGYSVLVAATATLSSGAVVVREELLGFAVDAVPDADGDGLPDDWEAQAGTNPAVADAHLDADGDGLTNAIEFRVGALPLLADSDGGGESDASEVAAGLDPANPRDDRVDAPRLQLTPGAGEVMVQTLSHGRVVVERVTAAGGYLSQAFAGTPPAAEPLSLPAVNGVNACYRMRTEGASGVSGWSAVQCATPGRDPYPPTAELTGPRSSGSRLVTVTLGASDDVSVPGHDGPRLVGAGTHVSGLRDMRLTTAETFDGVGWVPYQARATVWLPAGGGDVRAQVRDTAGNVSEARPLHVNIASAGPLDDAIALEEAAMDGFATGNLALVRQKVAASIPVLTEQIHALRPGSCSPGRAALGVELLRVKVLKAAVVLLARPATKQVAERQLREALEGERRVAARLSATP